MIVTEQCVTFNTSPREEWMVTETGTVFFRYWADLSSWSPAEEAEDPDWELSSVEELGPSLDGVELWENTYKFLAGVYQLQEFVEFDKVG